LLAGCAPAQRLDTLANAYGFQRKLVEGAHFRLVTYRNRAMDGKGAVLHVYLEGDGLPWRTRYEVSWDPTPRDPLALRLMKADPAPAVYLGRPCYDGQAAAPGCGPRMWTVARYAPVVLASMRAALTRILARSGYSGIVLIGYSGGGTLAMLLAARLPQTRGVITIGGNLDPARWALLHRYSPLAASLNPADEPPLDRRIRQVHYVGSDDRDVPPGLVRGVARQQPGAAVIVIPGFDHRCCWEAVWPSLLKRFDDGAKSQSPAQ
jgi:pimeloyl-ACP methyl ester carboxylesterase